MRDDETTEMEDKPGNLSREEDFIEPDSDTQIWSRSVSDIFNERAEQIAMERRTFFAAMAKWSMVIMGSIVVGPGLTDPNDCSSWYNFGKPNPWGKNTPHVKWGKEMPYVKWGKNIPHVKWGKEMPYVKWGKEMPYVKGPWNKASNPIPHVKTPTTDKTSIWNKAGPTPHHLKGIHEKTGPSPGFAKAGMTGHSPSRDTPIKNDDPESRHNEANDAAGKQDGSNRDGYIATEGSNFFNEPKEPSDTDQDTSSIDEEANDPVEITGAFLRGYKRRDPNKKP